MTQEVLATKNLGYYPPTPLQKCLYNWFIVTSPIDISSSIKWTIVFVNVIHTLTFLNKLEGRLQALSANIRLGLNGMSVTNSLAYYDTEYMMT